MVINISYFSKIPTILTDIHVYFRKSLHPPSRRSLPTGCGRNIVKGLYINYDAKITINVDSETSSVLPKDTSYASVLSSEFSIHGASYNQTKTLAAYAITKEHICHLNLQNRSNNGYLQMN